MFSRNAIGALTINGLLPSARTPMALRLNESVCVRVAWELESCRPAGCVRELRCLTALPTLAEEEQPVRDSSLDPHQQAADLQQHAADP